MPDSFTACSTVVPSGKFIRRTTCFSGNAYTTSMSIFRSGTSINFFCALDECFHEAVGNDEENGAYQFFQKYV